MENYDPNISYGDHVVRVHLQLWGYRGSVDVAVGGNCHGKEIIETAMEAISEAFCEGDEEGFVKNDINLKIESEYGSEGPFLVTAILTDDNGEALEMEEDADDIHKRIVGVEIISYTKGERP